MISFSLQNLKMSPYLHMFPERAGVCIGLVTHFADIWLVRCVHVHVLFPVAAVRKAPVAAVELAFKWLLTCKWEQTLGF